ncbi:MAG: 3'(2'),5'-bisphosphate nucleotidase CysQ [Proteobacteria bacterium]|nr:3'(2'),5'-bisphosphate nucleotidase CysQ [Pseudomonadota bacterium]
MSTPQNDLAALRPAIVDLARRAATAILEIYEGGFAVRSKADRTPLTEADERSEAIIVAGLRELTPDISIVAEESQARGETAFAQPAPSQFWLVDPLDGTREFVDRNGQFAVNIGLIRDGRPVLGAILVPVEGIVWSGIVGVGAFRQVRAGTETPIRARVKPAKGIVVVTSRSHASGAESAVASAHTIAEHRRLGSAAKFGLIAEGSADLYPRMGPTSEWDTCAGEALLIAAGGHVERTDGRLLEYGKPGFRNPDFVARGAW